MVDSFLLGGKAVRQLRDNHERLRLEVQKLNARVGNYKHQTDTGLREDAVIGKAETAISARAGTTLGSGTVSIFNKTAGSGVIADSGRTDVTAYNVTDEAIASGEYVRMVRDFRSGDWLVETVESTGGGSSVREISYVKAQGYWTQTGSDYPSATSAVVASVSVKKCDLDGTVTGAAFTCYLPVTNSGHDPNVVPDQIFIATETEDPSDSATSWSALSGHEDAAIGTVRMMTGNFPADESTGWSEMDGNQTTSMTASGSAIDMSGSVPKHHATVGTASSGQDEPSTAVSSFSGATGSDGGEATGTSSAGSHTHGVGSHSHSYSSTSGWGGATTGSSSGTTGTASGYTGYSGILTTSTHSEPLVWAETDYSYYEEVAGFSMMTDDDYDGEPEDFDHNHEVPSHRHDLGSHQHSIGDHVHAGGSHQHSVSGTTSSASGTTGSDGSHSHSVTTSDHTHSLTVSGQTCEQQKTTTLRFYERVSNADYA